jgi:hypothetical protein
MEIKVNNVNGAFHKLIRCMAYGTKEDSRNGPVLRINEPVTVTYMKPVEKVLFNPARDCNPFFHVMEALWMLAGRNDVAYLDQFNSNMKNYSDDGKTFHGAYGYRWRKYFGYDQLDWIVDELKANPESRRCVLQMWDGGRTKTTVTAGWNCSDCGNWGTPEETTEVDECTGDLYVATHGGKDVPCNTNIYFSLRKTGHDLSATVGALVPSYALDMTVCNRSNDLIWGMLGANVVHMSFLLEYMAARIGVEVGYYHQFTNNLHAYLDKWTPELWTTHPLEDNYEFDALTPVPLVNDPIKFDREVDLFMTHPDSYFKEPFLANVALPMLKAFRAHKLRNYKSAQGYMGEVTSPDWNLVGREWLERRELAWRSKHGQD